MTSFRQTRISERPSAYSKVASAMQKCEMSGRIHQFQRAMRFYGGPMEEALRILRGEADLCRRLAAAIHDRDVIEELLEAADDAESKIARLSQDRSAELTVH